MNLGISLSIGSQPSTGFGGTLIERLVESTATLAVYDWTDIAAMTAGDGGTVAEGGVDTIATVPNAKTPGTLNRVQTVLAGQPTYNAGAVYDGANDFMQTTFTANTGPSNVTLVYVLKTTDTEFCLGGTNSASFGAGLAQDGVGTAPHLGTGFTSTTYYADGSLIGTVTRDGLHTAWATGAAVKARLVGMNYQNASITDIRDRFANSGFEQTGTMMLVAIIDGGDPDYANAVTLAEQEAARLITVLGL